MKRTLQSAFVILGISGLAWAYVNVLDPYLSYVERRSHPPLRGQSVLAADIERESAQRRFNQFSLEYRRVAALVEAARASGRDVRALQEKLARAAQLAREGRMGDAGIYLNLAEVQIPRASEAVRPAVEEDAANIFPELKKKPAKRAAKKKKRRS